ncbi:head-tail adaptor protein [Massilia sp. S19_KUP03_FR1]|uniref:head-tail adaptor protein n=1 Tax=Massilia sp. S19_KUP03_FR1 TaxID=3025503 RepID=UPI002FCCCE15
MAAPFTCDDQVSIEYLTGTKHPIYGTDTGKTWVPLHSYFWANVQDVLPSRAEATGNGLAIGTRRARLRIRDAAGTVMTMRVRLHSRGDEVMQIVAGPARVEGTDYDEFAIESYSSDRPT